MVRTQSEMTRDLKDYIVDIQSDAHNKSGLKVYRYNNLKVEIVDPRTSVSPQVRISIGISEAIFSIQTGERLYGGLGPDERYITRWFAKNSITSELMELWKLAESNVGKVTTAEENKN